MPKTFLFLQGKNTFSGEKRRVFAVVDGLNQYVRDGEGKEVLSSGETRDSLATRIETEDETSEEYAERESLQIEKGYLQEGISYPEKQRQIEVGMLYSGEIMSREEAMDSLILIFDSPEGKEFSKTEQEEIRSFLEKGVRNMTEEEQKKFGEYAQRLDFQAVINFYKNQENLSEEKKEEIEWKISNFSSYINAIKHKGNIQEFAKNEFLKFTERELQKGEKLNVEDHLRKAIDMKKKVLMMNPKNIEPIVTLIKKQGRDMNPEESKEARQMIINILATGKEKTYSKENLKKQIQRWQRGALNKPEGIKNKHYEKLFRDKGGKNEQYLTQMAAYELAQTAKHTLGDDTMETNDLKEATGLAVLHDRLLKGDFNWDEIGTIPNNLMDKQNPQNLLLGYGLKYAGLLMALFNTIAFIQSKGANTQALAYAAGGFGMIYGGAKTIKYNSLDSFFNPENRVYNITKTLTGSQEKPLLKEFSSNIEFYKNIDFTSKENEKIFFKETGKTRKIDLKAQREIQKKYRKENGENLDLPKYRDQVSVKDLQEGGDLEDLVLDGADHDLIANEADDVQTQKRRYRAIRWLFKHNIRNDQFDELAIHSRSFLMAQPGKTPVENMLGMQNPYDTTQEQQQQKKFWKLTQEQVKSFKKPQEYENPVEHLMDF